MSEKEYDLGFGCMGNGITVWNRLEEVDNDYKTVAHISADGKTIKYYEDLPEKEKQRIEKVAENEILSLEHTEVSEDDEEFEM